MSNYVPLRITAQMAEPIIMDRNQPLDGILGAVIVSDPEFRARDREYRKYRRNVEKFGREDAENYYREHGMTIPENPHFLPLAVYGHGKKHGLWVYCSSFAIPGDTQSGRTYFNKRLDTLQMSDWFGPIKTRIDTGKGQTKAEHIPMVYTITDSLTWYACGCESEVRETLAIAFSIAKKRNRGYGGVREWSVERADCDWSVWRDNRIMRPVPVDLLSVLGIDGEFETEFTTYRPPYWDGRYVAECAVGGERR